MVHLGDSSVFQEVNEYFVSYALSSYVVFECSDCIQDTARNSSLPSGSQCFKPGK